MFKDNNEKINAIETIIKDLKNQLTTTGDFDTQYFQSYFEFLKFFKDKDKITDSDFIIAAHFTYGWMPTIPSIIFAPGEQPNKSEVSIILTEVIQNKEGFELNHDRYKILVTSINNSMIGTSKLLHFIKPDVYPIIDSRVVRYLDYTLNKKIPSYDKKISIKNYIDYKDFCHAIITSTEFLNLKNLLTNKLPSYFTDIRILEYLFFTFGKKDNLEKEE